MGLAAAPYRISDLTLAALDGYTFEPAAIEIRALTPAHWTDEVPGKTQSACPVKRQHASIAGRTIAVDSIGREWLIGGITVSIAGPAADTVVTGDVGPGQFIFRALQPGDYVVTMTNPFSAFHFDSTVASVTLDSLEVANIAFRGRRLDSGASDAATPRLVSTAPHHVHDILMERRR